MFGDAPAVKHGRLAAGRAWRGLAAVVTGSDHAPVWRSPRWRWVSYCGLGAGALIAYLATLKCLPGGHFYLQAMLFGADAPMKYSLPAPTQLVVLVLAGALGPLLLAVRYPLLGWRIAWLALLLLPVAGIYWRGRWLWDPVELVVLVVVFCAATMRQPRPVGWWMWALTLIPWWWWVSESALGLAFGISGTIGFTAVAIAADAMGSWGRTQRALAGQAELTELERARRAVLEERARIARELHDVVAHHMSLLAVRAETAPYRMPGLPAPVAAEFGSLSEAAREALAEMRQLLKILRDDRPAARTPQPQLPDLPGLIEAARQAGVAVKLSIPTRLDRVPSAVEVCAYRIVQEALSNARRHAPGTAVTVTVAQSSDALRLQVANGPTPLPANGHPPVNGRPAVNGRHRQPLNSHQPGQGLAGMRERVALLGGQLSTGPAPEGGYVVSAMLPAGEPA